MVPPLSLSTGPASLKVRVYPAVLLTICDAYVRRSSKQNRVVGTLLGQIIDGTVEVKSCYAVPHIEAPESVSNQFRTLLPVPCAPHGILSLTMTNKMFHFVNKVIMYNILMPDSDVMYSFSPLALSHRLEQIIACRPQNPLTFIRESLGEH